MKRIKSAQLFKVDGSMSIITPGNGNDFSLQELQKYVDGLIDIVNLPNSELIMVVNDEGRFCKEYNSMASMLCTRFYGRECELYGDVLVCHTDMVK